VNTTAVMAITCSRWIGACRSHEVGLGTLPVSKERSRLLQLQSI
jgi:hypothetical protein